MSIRQLVYLCVPLWIGVPVVGVSQQPPAKEKDPVQAAINRGRDYLLIKYNPRGPGPGQNDVENLLNLVGIHGNGKASLVGLALLESGVVQDHPVMTYIANTLRVNAVDVTNTYEVSLIIMFLDRLGMADDIPLIQFMTLRLLSGQCADGTWSYNCDGVPLNPVEARQLKQALVRQTRMVTPANKDKPQGPAKGKRDNLDDLDVPPKIDPKKPTPKAKETPTEPPPTDNDPALSKIHPVLRPLARQMANQNQRNGQNARLPSGDHSNTQFATVGLWCGRRHHVETTDAFKLLEKHYRECQSPDYGWGYTGQAGASSPAMTCAGLMGLAMGQGATSAKLKTPGAGGKNDAPPEDNNENKKPIDNGLKYLGDYLAAAANERNGNNRGFMPSELSSNLYFMWSLERVAMIYGLSTIGKVDWYEWGSQCLIATQDRNGSWNSTSYHGANPELNTAFALLFLNRANLAQDLSSSLKGKYRDPGTSRMRGGDLATLLKNQDTTGSKPKTTPKNNLPPMVEPKSPSPMPPDPKPVTTPANTKPMLPKVTIDPTNKPAQLAAKLLAAEGDDQRKLFDLYRDGKGSEYTEALLEIASKQGDFVQDRARDTLASRLTRMKADTLNQYLRHDNREMRFAAARACGAKQDKSHTPELIRLLADTDPGVIQAARVGLKLISGKDFGPDATATVSDKKKAVVAWQKWWESQQ